MAKELSFKKQRELIRLALKREYPQVEEFVMGTGITGEGTTEWQRHISVNFRERDDLKTEDVKVFLERFTHDPVNAQGVAFLRTFWVNKDGHITLARIRAQYEDGTTSLMGKRSSVYPSGLGGAKRGGYRYFDYRD